MGGEGDGMQHPVGHEPESIFTLQTYNVLYALSHLSTRTPLSYNTFLHLRVRKWIFYMGPGLNSCCIIQSTHTNVQCTQSFVWNLLHWNAYCTSLVCSASPWGFEQSTVYPSDYNTAHTLLGKFSLYFIHHMHTAEISFAQVDISFAPRCIANRRTVDFVSSLTLEVH